ncbi:hypothetical protein ACWDBO_49025 [Streptomyces mirabilis]|uniref:hypothetical protein n=1 Tax=Streptomyces TaxID=1883 RepID=UPI0029BA24B2|nr:hypothetical protein [Streptomyces sp. AK02-04a]MDX3763296.1 hypothetical protein [Streptomyces sp. AK02-04a]
MLRIARPLALRIGAASLAVVALTGGGLVLAAPADAAACDTWGATGTPGDIAGAYAHGSLCDDPVTGRLDLEALLKDTSPDGMSACVQIHATYADGGTRDEWVYNSGGSGSTKVADYTFASSVRNIWVREGLGKGGVCTSMAGGVHSIYTY